MPPVTAGGTAAVMHQRVRAAGATRRQLEYWVEKGWVVPEAHAPEPGRPRVFSDIELSVLSVLVALTAAGFTARAAAPVARRLVAEGVVELGPGLRLVLDGDD